jgi:hypothetical protein
MGMTTLRNGEPKIMNHDFRGELGRLLGAISSRPGMYGTAYHSEGMIIALAAAAHAYDNNCSIDDSLSVVLAKVKDLVADVPKASVQVVFLCEERAIPKRVESYSLLRERSSELISRVLGSPDSRP